MIPSSTYPIAFYFRNTKFVNKSGSAKRVASEEIIEVEEYGKKPNLEAPSTSTSSASTVTTEKIAATKAGTSNTSSLNHKFVRPSISVGGLSNSKSVLKNLVKKKTNDVPDKTVCTTAKSTDTTSMNTVAATKPGNSSNALSLLAGYDDYSDSDDSD